MANEKTPYVWSTSPSGNQNADGFVPVPEPIPARDVNDALRKVMAVISAWLIDGVAGLTTAGTSIAYTVETEQDWETLEDGMTLVIVPHATCGADPTLEADSIATWPIKTQTGAAIGAGALLQGVAYPVRFNEAEEEWRLCAPLGVQVTSEIEAAIAAATQGIQTIWVPAAAMVKRTSNGPANYSAEAATNKVMVVGLAFDKDADEFAQFDVRMPKSWNEGTVTAAFRWTAPSGSGNVVWGIQGLARSDDDALDAAFGAAQTVTDTLIATDDEHATAETSAITIGGTPAEADRVIFQVYRDADNGSDTFSADAVLIGVTLFYTTNAAIDA